MIVNDGYCYLYRHIRLDNNQVFYIGVGVKRINTNQIYYRAFDKKQRGIWWKNIINKTLYKVEILLESDDYKFILEKEKEFIKLYGRKDLGLGTLVNLNNGGKEGENVLKICKKVYQFDLDYNFIREWDSTFQIAREMNENISGIYKCCNVKNGYKTWNNYIWAYNKVFEKENKNHERKTAQYDLQGNLLETFKSLKEASEKLKIENTAIRQALLKDRVCKGYQFKYFDKDPLLKIDSNEPLINKQGVNQYDLEGNFIKKWDTIYIAAKELDIFHVNIIKTAKYKRKSAGNFQWRYTDDLNLVTKIKREKDVEKKPIKQFDLNMNFIKEYESSREACRQLSLEYKKLSHAKIRKKEYGGFYWKD
jgi:hypothetical protein